MATVPLAFCSWISWIRYKIYQQFEQRSRSHSHLKRGSLRNEDLRITCETFNIFFLRSYQGFTKVPSRFHQGVTKVPPRFHQGLLGKFCHDTDTEALDSFYAMFQTRVVESGVSSFNGKAGWVFLATDSMTEQHQFLDQVIWKDSRIFVDSLEILWWALKSICSLLYLDRNCS